MGIVADLVVLALATNQAVEIWHHSSLFAGKRSNWEARQGFLPDLLKCPWCLSVWVGTLQALLWFASQTLLEEWWWALNFFTIGLAASRAANLLNDVAYALCRTPRLSKTSFEVHDGIHTRSKPADTAPDGRSTPSV